VQEYKDALIKKAEDLIVVGFPAKIVELNELLATKAFAERDFSDVHQDLNINVPDPVSMINNIDDDQHPPAKRARVETADITGSKVMILPEGSVRCNAPICEIIKVVKVSG
jgi:proteasome activator subunit 3 (PA28 gamma)